MHVVLLLPVGGAEVQEARGPRGAAVAAVGGRGVVLRAVQRHQLGAALRHVLLRVRQPHRIL